MSAHSPDEWKVHLNLRTAEYPRPDYFLLHLSDTHVLADGGRLYDQVDSTRHLAELFAEVEASSGRPDAIIITGDLADKGEPDAYALVRSIVEPAAARLGARVIWVMGNHDDRSAFRAELLGQPSSTAPIDRVDYIGASLLSGGVGALILLATWGGTQYAWGSRAIIGLGILAVVAIGVPMAALGLSFVGGAAFAVGGFRRANQFGLAADLQLLNALGPAGNYLR